MDKVGKCAILLLLLAVFSAPVAAAPGGENIKLAVGEKTAYVDGSPEEMRVAPLIKEDITMVPLRFLLQARGVEVSWNQDRKEAVLQDGDKTVVFQVGNTTARVNGAEKVCAAAPCIEDGTLLVPLRVFGESFDYEVTYRPESKEITLQRAPNRMPVARFEIQQDTVARGETVIYEDKSYDLDGDELVDKKWAGKKRAFFEPGEYEVTLRVKDSRGGWSEPCTRVVQVTEEVKMDKLHYFLHHPVPGEPLEPSGYDILDFKTLYSSSVTNSEKIMISNSPEKISKSGILYSDVLNGKNRVFYHHLNVSAQEKKVFLLAQNTGGEPVKLQVARKGTAGPGDPMNVGRVAARRYLDFRPGSQLNLELAPGKTVILNRGQGSAAAPGKAVHGIFDIEARGDLQFSVIAVDTMEEAIKYEELPALPSDEIHLRGTFDNANRSKLVELEGKEPSRLVVGDGKSDPFLGGELKKLWVRNKGNYGLSYELTIKSEQRVGVLLSPRGGAFAGAARWDGEAFNLPNRGVLSPQTECGLIGVVEPGEEKVLEFMPPAGSSLPVNIIFLPF